MKIFAWVVVIQLFAVWWFQDDVVHSFQIIGAAIASALLAVAFAVEKKS